MIFEFLFMRKLIKWNLQTVQKSDLIISNSQYSAQKLLKYFKIKSEVIYPFIEFKDYKTESNEKRYITIINPTKSKGIETFIKIAKLKKELNFLAVGKTDPKIKNRLIRLENIDYIKWTDDIKEIYAKTYILLVPSKEETFGRIAVEGMLNGIPVIGSNVGGIPEIIPIELIVKDTNSLTEWIEKLNLIINNYQSYSKLVINKASHFDSSISIKKFQNLIESELNLSL